MKKLLKKIGDFFFNLYYFRKNRRFAGYEARLNKAIKDKEVDQLILKAEIMQHMKGYLKVNARSKYIPKDIKNDAEIKQQVLGVFGDRMKKLDITINDNLVLCTL